MRAQTLNRRLVEILDNALDGAGQIADALNAAHRLANEIRIDDSG